MYISINETNRLECDELKAIMFFYRFIIIVMRVNIIPI